MTSTLETIPLWLDCDPGHDDAMAIILAGYHPEVELLGISTVVGNQTIGKVTANALRILTYAGLKGIEVYEGIGKPLLAETRHAPDVHGESGMDIANTTDGSDIESTASVPITQTKNPQKAVLALRDAVIANSEAIVKVICTGPLTNMAMFLTLFPELIDRIEVICMGGAIGLGSRTPAAESNFLADPHSGRAVFKSGVKLTMIPLEVTHLALFTPEVSDAMFPKKKTPFQTYISRLLQFVANAYNDIYGMKSPAIHDPCAVYYAIKPEHFEVKFIHVDIETKSRLCSGRSVCDIHARLGLPRNCYVGTSLKVDKFWACMIDAVNKANEQSPMNNY